MVFLTNRFLHFYSLESSFCVKNAPRIDCAPSYLYKKKRMHGRFRTMYAGISSVKVEWMSEASHSI